MEPDLVNSSRYGTGAFNRVGKNQAQAKDRLTRSEVMPMCKTAGNFREARSALACICSEDRPE